MKSIIHYLKATANKGTIFMPKKDLDLDLYCDADFAGLYQHDPNHEPTSVKSQLGWVIFLSGCPLVWRSTLKQCISTHSSESEYSWLSLSLKSFP